MDKITSNLGKLVHVTHQNIRLAILYKNQWSYIDCDIVGVDHSDNKRGPKWKWSVLMLNGTSFKLPVWFQVIEKYYPTCTVRPSWCAWTP